jgi:hypothetical protein
MQHLHARGTAVHALPSPRSLPAPQSQLPTKPQIYPATQQPGPGSANGTNGRQKTGIATPTYPTLPVHLSHALHAGRGAAKCKSQITTCTWDEVIGELGTLAWLRACACAIVGVYVIGVIGIIDIPTYRRRSLRADKGSRGKEEASSPESRIRAFGGVGRVSRAASERVGTAAQPSPSPTYPSRG